MSAFDEREKAFESKFAQDEALEFRAESRRNRLVGEWAARKMGLENVEDYVRAVVRSDFEQPGDEDVFRKVTQDLSGAGIEVRESEVRTKMDEFLAMAREQVKAGQ
ncbi:MAG TPA: DUF1476 domain-containing protein [Caulobacteraceae bacterium]|nr:DUF1476 domain-containing protein [Caulobacteraceae bacterium]